MTAMKVQSSMRTVHPMRCPSDKPCLGASMHSKSHFQWVKFKYSVNGWKIYGPQQLSRQNSNHRSGPPMVIAPPWIDHLKNFDG